MASVGIMIFGFLDGIFLFKVSSVFVKGYEFGSKFSVGMNGWSGLFRNCLIIGWLSPLSNINATVATSHRNWRSSSSILTSSWILVDLLVSEILNNVQTSACNDLIYSFILLKAF